MSLQRFLPKGDALRGARLFNNQDKSKCTVCHLKGGMGVRLGPDLDVDWRDTQRAGPAGGDRLP